MSTHYFIACDLGAESGRVMLGTLAGGKLELEEIHRFPNLPVRLPGSVRWDVLGIFGELKEGMRRIAARGLPITSVSVDSWGVDYVWTSEEQPMLAPAYIYRDARIDAAFASVKERVPAETIFTETGIQFMPFNTVYQLFADVTNSPRLLAAADRFLCIADYFNFLFSGVAAIEESLASTTQLYDPRKRGWSVLLAEAIGLPPRLLPRIVPSGTQLGTLAPEVAEETGLGAIEVVAACSHDTGAAVAAVPADAGDDWAFLSSGTWSLIGVELSQPLISAGVQAANFTNEGGYGGTTRFLKNIVGLWILQECRREWERIGGVSEYGKLNDLAAKAAPHAALIDPEDPRFLKPGGMLEKIASYCVETGQTPPSTPGAITRCILESLALLYREQLAHIEKLTGRSITKLHVVGGGSKSELLNQFAASATGRTVMAGPVEATAIGNVLVQAITAGQLDSLAALRNTVRTSFDVKTYAPSDADVWQAAYEHFTALRN